VQGSFPRWPGRVARERKEPCVTRESLSAFAVGKLLFRERRIEFGQGLDAMLVRQASGEANRFEIDEANPGGFLGIDEDMGSLEISVGDSLPMKVDGQPEKGFDTE